SARWYDAEPSYCYARTLTHGWWGSWQVPPGTSLARGHPASPDVQFFQNRVVLQTATLYCTCFRGNSSLSMTVAESQQLILPVLPQLLPRVLRQVDNGSAQA